MKKFYNQHKKKIHFIGALTVAKWIIVGLVLLIIGFYAKPDPIEELDMSIIGRADTTTPSDFNLTRYMGSWHEIARYPTIYQAGCECVTANYALINDSVSVQNTCLKNGKFTSITGTAFTTSTPGVLEVQFTPFMKGDYRVVYVDKNYENAIVSNKAQDNLWLLSKKPTSTTADELTAIAASKHFNTSKLYYGTGCTYNG